MKKIIVIVLSLFMIVGCTTRNGGNNENISKHFEAEGWKFEIENYASDYTGWRLVKVNNDDNQSEWISIVCDSMELLQVEYTYQERKDDTVFTANLVYDSKISSLEEINYSSNTAVAESDTCLYNYNDSEKEHEITTCEKGFAQEKRGEMEQRFDQALGTIGINQEELAQWIEWYASKEGWIK